MKTDELTTNPAILIRQAMQILHEKVSHIVELLHGWGWSFSDLVRHWILHNDGAQGKRCRGQEHSTVAAYRFGCDDEGHER